MEGDVIWDSISQLDFYMTVESTLTGAITDDETYAETAATATAMSISKKEAHGQ